MGKLRKIININNAGKLLDVGHTGPSVSGRSIKPGQRDSAPFPVDSPDSGETSNSRFGGGVKAKPSHVKRTKGY